MGISFCPVKEFRCRNLLTWTAAIAACSRVQPPRAREAERAYQSMLQQSLQPDEVLLRRLEQ
ncbi:unnamed protein product, partial [Symbiodinium natans]